MPKRSTPLALYAMLLVAALAALSEPREALAESPPQAPMVAELHETLTPPDPWTENGFGNTVEIDGDTAVVAAPHEEIEDAFSAGAVYIFQRTNGTWQRSRRLTADTPVDDEYFGETVALEGDTLLVGTPGEDVGDETYDAGAALLYTRTEGTWTYQTRLVASDAGIDDGLGTSLALDGETAVVGTPFEDHGGVDSAGAAYMFTRSGGSWSEQQKLTASEGAGHDLFAGSVGVSGDTVVVGAKQVDHGGSESAGAAYLFTRDDGAWSQRRRLTSPNARSGDWFGDAVAIDGDIALVGATDAGEEAEGVVYVYRRDDGSWSWKTRLEAPESRAARFFGWSLALEGDVAVVADNQAEHSDLFQAGAAFVYARQSGEWHHQADLIADDPLREDSFGYDVGLSGGTVLVGTNWDSTHDELGRSGAAYGFGLLSDRDDDGVADRDDNCPDTDNPDQTDTDDDGAGQVCDGCPEDPHKTDPGVCGCGNVENDSDSDGVPDCQDACPTAPGPTDGTRSGCPTRDAGSSSDTMSTPDVTGDTDTVSEPDGVSVTLVDTGSDSASSTEGGCRQAPTGPAGPAVILFVLVGLGWRQRITRRRR